MEVVKNSEAMERQWSNYREDFDYAANIEFFETSDIVARVMNNLLL